MLQYIYEVKMDGVTYESRENLEAGELTDVKIYISEPLFPLPDATLENFMYEDFDEPSTVYIGKDVKHLYDYLHTVIFQILVCTHLQNPPEYTRMKKIIMGLTLHLMAVSPRRRLKTS